MMTAFIKSSQNNIQVKIQNCINHIIYIHYLHLRPLLFITHYCSF